MSPVEVYKDYLALRNHFNSDSYDYFKYNAKARGNLVDAFHKRKDKFFFEKLAKHKDPHGFMVANFANNPKTWIRDIAYSDDAEKLYQQWLKRKESLTYLIQSDLEKLDFPFDSNFVVKDGQLSSLLTLLLGNKIHLETVCVLTDMVGCYSYWDKQLKDDVIWQDLGKMIKKYTPFVRYDREKVKKIVVDFFKE